MPIKRIGLFAAWPQRPHFMVSPMNRIMLLIVLLLLCTSTGCTVSDALFGVFGGGYSGGGSTWEEKKYDYDQRVSASTSYDP
ncbi:hypothetical protein C5Y96_10845 [Blastopirellula marina]|uniref:Uncharacterized protein n=1 Tax=Blastopirellula marina TaxID=124 RepID=A0A2S8FMF0_9BACT|nr:MULTISPECIES: hypothetical protein [Pirellulaceae]PQO33341.1 hypothetical protein C5Y96_10845 [Blastopirellula marina]RCS52430.1 hypothetical protein DTL36_10855 [Bremerella cremea]